MEVSTHLWPHKALVLRSDDLVVTVVIVSFPILIPIPIPALLLILLLLSLVLVVGQLVILLDHVPRHRDVVDDVQERRVHDRVLGADLARVTV
jgi:hypothetical protein